MLRKDQIEKMEQLAEQLADRFMLEADPAQWPGQADTPPAKWTDKERGDAWWCKKNAMGTGGVLRFTIDVLLKLKAPPPAPGELPPDEGDLEAQVKEAGRQAAKAMDDAKRRSKQKPEYDRRTHGG